MSTSPQTVPEHSLILEKHEDGVATLTLNRPDKLNALNTHLAVALNEALGRLSTDKNIHAVILTGAGRAFCAGGDLAEIWKGRQENNVADLEPLLRAGMNIALAADVRFASDAAVFGQNFAKVGLFPDYGGTFFLPQLIGPAKAAEMLYTGDMIDAKAALQLGLVNRLVPADKLEGEAMAFAKGIVHGPRLASRALKQVLFGNQRAELAKALEYEVEEQMKCFASEDCAEGLRAFFEKRKPNFQGK